MLGWLLWWFGVVGALLTIGVCEWLLWVCLFMVVGVACVLLCCSVVWVDLVVCCGLDFLGRWFVLGFGFVGFDL